MAIQFADKVRVTTPTTGTGTISLGAAVAGYRSFAMAVADGALASGATVFYTIEDSGNAWEIGSGVYTSGVDTLTRTVTSSSSGSALSLSGSAQVCLTVPGIGLASLVTAPVASALAASSIALGSSTATASTLSLDASPGYTRDLYFNTNAVARWRIFATATVESGSNVGSNLNIRSHSDTGVLLATPITITRSTGFVSIAQGISISGSATAATAALNTSSTLIATTQFVLGQISTTTPLIAGTAAIGTATTFAKADHAHPTDTTRQAALGYTPVQSGGGTSQQSGNRIHLGWMSDNSGAKIFIDATDLGNVITTNYPQNYVQTGTSASFAQVTGTIGAGNGTCQMTVGSSTNTGFLGFFNASGTRMGYIGFGTSAVFNMVAESTTTGWSTNLTFNVGTTLQVNNNAHTNTLTTGNLFVSASATGYSLGIDGSNNRIMSYNGAWCHMWRSSDGSYIYLNNVGTTLYYSDATTGDFYVRGTVTQNVTSDERTKRNIQPYTRGLADLIRLKPISFQYNGLGAVAKDGKTYYGVIAQQALPHVPECVTLTEAADKRSGAEKPPAGRLPEQLSVNHKPLIFAALNAFKEIDARLKAIEQHLAA